MANENFSIRDIINEQTKNIDDANTTNEVKADDNAQLVRYKGGETAKDRNGNEYKDLDSNPLNWIFDKGKGKFAPGTIKAKKGEPETGDEWASDAAQKIWDSGKSMDEVEAEMNKQWPLASAIIKDNDNAAWDAESSGRDENIQYYDKKEVTDITDGEKYIHYRSPREQAEVVLAKRYGFDLDDGDAMVKESPYRPSVAIGILHKTGLKKDWENLINSGNKSTPKEFYNNYKELRNKLLDLDTLKSAKELKKLGFASQEDFDTATNFLIKSLDRKAASIANSYLDKARLDNERLLNKTEAKPETVPAKPEATNEVAKPKTVPAKPEVTNEVAKPETVPAKPEATNEVAKPEDDATFSLEEVRLNTEATAQEKRAQEEAETIAKKEFTRKEAEELDKKLEEAAKKKQQKLFDYEDWLKNPTIISGIFGKSGLSAARRVGLGLATLFAIFSDVAANYGKGINNNTDFKTAAMDQLNSTIKTIQDKRAEAAGILAAKPYETATDAEEKLNKDYEKMRRLPVGTYIPKSTLQAFIQESQIDTKEPMSESLYNRFMNESREGFIESIKRNKALRNAYLDEDGNLNTDGEAKFLEKQGKTIEQYKNALGLSDERLSNINNQLEMDKKKAEVRAKVHDVVFQTNKDYIDAINAMETENRTLEESKLGFTEAKTLEAMLGLAQKNRNVISGLATSSANTTEGTSDTEASVNRFTEQGGLEKVNETLKNHGWQAELNGKVGAEFPIKLIPISANISAGGKWTSEQANKHLQSEYENWTRDNQRSLTKARNLSAASGKNIDEAYNDIMNFLNSEKAKGAEANFDKVRQEVLNAINNKIQYNNQVIDELKEMRAKESKFDTGENNSVSTKNPYVSMFDDVPTKDANWYRHRLALS